MEPHAAQSASDSIMRGDLSPLGATSTANVGVVTVADVGQLEPIDFKVMVSTNGAQQRAFTHISILRIIRYLSFCSK